MPHAQRGIAILTAMLVVALGTIVVVAIASRQQFDLQREQNEGLIQQARTLAVSGERFAAVLLLRDKVDKLRNNSDSLDDDWAQTIPPIPVDAATIQGCIVDMQGRFNLNNLVSGAGGSVSADHLEQFKRLLRELTIEESKAEAVLDWLDTNLDATGSEGAENDYYTSLDPGCRAANQPMKTVSELALVKGFNPLNEQNLEDFEELLPHVAALPVSNGPTLVNVNTATPEVISSLREEFAGKGVEASRWETLAYEDYPECENIFDLSPDAQPGVGDGGQDFLPFESTGAFESEMGLAQPPEGATSLYGVQSDYFQVRIDVGSEGITLSQYTLFERDSAGRTDVLMRSRDAL